MYFSKKEFNVHFLYNIFIALVQLFLPITTLMSHKMDLFVKGRKTVFNTLSLKITSNKVIWMHVASLGEFEQGLPVLELLRKNYPEYQIVVTFFSPSGFEIKKNDAIADCITYLPLDTKKNAKRFITTVNPSLAIFVKYEFWPNYLLQLKSRNIPTLLISGIFRPKQAFFKPYGHFMRDALKAFSHLFVQNEQSKILLEKINFHNCTVAGDTRFDRVLTILERDNHLAFMDEFAPKNKQCLVIGSSWPEDEVIFMDSILKLKDQMKTVIAPHKIDEKTIHRLQQALGNHAVLHSELDIKNPKDHAIIIIDNIGMLTKIYSYATMAYVGGGMATGLHNILEPAVFGVPVIIGKEYKKFNEANDLVSLGGAISITSSESFYNTLSSLLNKHTKREKLGKINSEYLHQHGNASQKILQFIEANIALQ